MVSEYNSSRPFMEICQPSSLITISVASTDIGSKCSAKNTDHLPANMFIKTAASSIVIAMNFQRMREEPTVHDESER